MNPEYIVVHTAAYKGRNCDAKTIDNWHRAKGWSEIGYHFVIINDKHDDKPDGTLEKGRAINKSGAHTKGLNDKSIGICCIGHGDYNDFTAAQYTTLVRLLDELRRQYSIDRSRIIGHWEINHLVMQGIVSEAYKTHKSCPGAKVDLDKLRQRLAGMTASAASDVQQLRYAIDVIKANEFRFDQAKDELMEFLYHPEVIEILEE
jgi:N-acetyl-anhydromuramyl-L-alanine amidase AmpD